MTPERIAQIRSGPHGPGVYALLDEIVSLQNRIAQLEGEKRATAEALGDLLSAWWSEHVDFFGADEDTRTAFENLQAVNRGRKWAKTASGTVEHVREGE